MESIKVLNVREKVKKSAGLGSRRRFIETLYEILEDKNNSEVISWSPDGLSFIVKNQAQAFETLLSKHFSHSNYSSFIRQLSFYGFKKLPMSENVRVYQHPNFCKGRKDLIGEIKRLKLKGNQLAGDCKESLAEKSEKSSTESQQSEKSSKNLLSELEDAYRVIAKLRYENENLKKVYSKIQAQESDFSRTQYNEKNSNAFAQGSLNQYSNQYNSNASNYDWINTPSAETDRWNSTMDQPFHSKPQMTSDYDFNSANYFSYQNGIQNFSREWKNVDASVKNYVSPVQASGKDNADFFIDYEATSDFLFKY